MPEYIPFIPSENNYQLRVPLSDGTTTKVYLFNVRWNSRDAAWYFDLLNQDQTPIVYSVKIVLGAPLGRRSADNFFKAHVLQAADLGGSGADAGYDDLGDRVQILHTAISEFKRPSTT